MNRPVHTRFDVIHNRVLVRNSHKYVYKKLCNQNREQWCQKYLSVATSKLLDPKHTTKLPFSLTKKFKTQQSNQMASNSSFVFPKKKTQVLAIHDNHDFQRSITIDDDMLIKVSHKAERLLQRLKRSVVRTPSKINRHSLKENIKIPPRHKSKDEFEIQPWMVESQDVQDKQNRFF